ncbi:MAG: hypothetical protein J7J36_03195 [Thermoplasmata archaeon]|nr:hypothetical protein [Thermoplasmata archaeon]
MKTIGILIGAILLASFMISAQDTAPPSIIDVSVNPAIQLQNGYINISCIVIDNVRVNVVKVNITYPDSSTHNFTMNFLPPKPYYSPNYFYNNTYSQIGTYHFFIWANDTSGNSNRSGLYSFIITNDITPPDTYITAGPFGTIHYNDVIFGWNGSDDITPTSELVYSYKLEGYDCSWSNWTSHTCVEYRNLPNGCYIFKVRAKDEAGNVDPTPAEREFSVQIDNTPPVISNVEAEPNPQAAGGHVNITCIVRDDTQVGIVKVIIKYPTSRTVNETMHCSNDGSYYFDTTYSDIGKYYYHIWANDTSGNSAISGEHSFKIIREDNNPPFVHIKRPRGHLYIADREIIPTFKTIVIGRITVDTYAFDYETGIEKVEFYVDNSLKEVKREPPYNWLWNENAIGNHAIKVIAFDKAGNVNTDMIRIFIINF